jgi:hypothetical protein
MTKKRSNKRRKPFIGLLSILVGIACLVMAWKESQLTDSERAIKSINDFSKTLLDARLIPKSHDYTTAILLLVVGGMALTGGLIYTFRKRNSH